MDGANKETRDVIEIEHGSGGKKSNELIGEITKILGSRSGWKNTDDDGAVFDLAGKKFVFTTDAFIVDPIFFPGGDIGKLAICGTINDLAVMGASPIGISLSLVIEEGFPKEHLRKIANSIAEISRETKAPIVTGDTKVTEKGKIDKIEITTSGIGIAKHILSNTGARPGDLLISSGDLGEHAVALLAERFNYKTRIKSDCQPLFREINSVAKFLTCAKDPTRGGIAAVLNEVSEKSKVKIVLEEEKLPFKREAMALSDLLGIDKFTLPSEGRFIATAPTYHAKKIIARLKKFNRGAKIIGSVEQGRGVHLKTRIGSLRKIEIPEGKLIPRIC
ncbi:MAG: hydrogenase expression/formation protein HypE [Patescibacteria group bacterium]|nr:hydrogenase expression/formation protein HypE [Patescibacteria group bacterium]